VAFKQIVEVHALRRAGDPNAAPFALPSSGSISCAAASPGSSPSASRIKSRTSRGRSSDRRP
jgi:hypothetical protein